MKVQWNKSSGILSPGDAVRSRDVCFFYINEMVANEARISKKPLALRA